MFNHSKFYGPTWCMMGLIALSSALLLLFVSTAPVHAQSIDDGLVGYWPFDEGSGSTSADQAGSGNTATLYSPNSFTNSTAPTDFANPFALASINNPLRYATAPGNNIDNLQQITIAFWVRITAQTPFPDMDLVTLTNGKAWFGYYNRDNLFLQMKFGTKTFRLALISQPVTDGVYHHIAGSYDGRIMRLYLDGRLLNSYDTTDSLFKADGPLVKSQGIVFSSPTLPLDGTLDDVRIYSRALRDSEVMALTYNCSTVQGIPASECRALVALFSNTEGTKWTNHSGWLQNNTPCTWFGILCNNGHVYALSLPQNNLNGALPAALGNFPELIVLQLPTISSPAACHLNSATWASCKRWTCMAIN